MKRWEDDEPGRAEIARELFRLGRRALSRPLLTLGITLILAAGVTTWRALRTARYTSRVVLRVSEVVPDDLSPALNRDVRAYVQDVAFTRARLTQVMKQFNIAPARLASDPVSAIESFRDDVIVEAWQNDFLGASVAGERRTAHLAVSWAATDPERAFDVTRALARIVVEAAQSNRVASLDLARRSLEMTIEGLRTRLTERELEAARMQLKARRNHSPDLQIALDGLEHDKIHLNEQLAIKNRELNSMSLSAHAAHEQLGLDFNIVDDGQIPRRLLRRWPQLVSLGLLVLMLSLPVVSVVVATWDTRIDQADDVARLGLPVIGEVPAFPGDQHLALAARELMDRG